MRSKWKGPFVHPLVISAVRAAIQGAAGGKPRTPIRIMNRASTIIPEFLGLKFEVHNGKDYIPVEIKEKMIGHKFGEFAATRKIPPVREALSHKELMLRAKVKKNPFTGKS